MANGVLGQLRPYGDNGNRFNIRASEIFHFKKCTTSGGHPGNGEAGVQDGNTRKILALRDDNLVVVKNGMIVSFIAPSVNIPTKIAIYGYDGTSTDSPLSVNPIDIDFTTLDEDVTEDHWYVMVYDEANLKFRCINSHVINSVTQGVYNPVTSNAVFQYISQMVENKWKYVVCPANASDIPAGAVYDDGINTPITGTMTATQQTEYTIYLVLHNHDTQPTSNKDIYDEWITVDTGTGGSHNYIWEKIGNTDVDLSGIISRIADHNYDKATSVTGSSSLTSGSTDNTGAHTHTVQSKNKTAVTTGVQSANGVTITSVVDSTSTGNYTPQGTVEGTITITGTAEAAGDHVHSVTATGTVTTDGTTGANVVTKVVGKNHTHSVNDITYTPSGSITSGNTGDAEVVTDVTGNDLHVHDIALAATNDLTVSGIEYVQTVQGKQHSHNIVLAMQSTGTQDVITDITFQQAGQASNKTINGIGNSLQYVSGFTAVSGTAPSLTITNKSVQSVTNVGSASSYSVTGEVLTFNASVVPTIQEINIGSASGWDAGSTPSTYDFSLQNFTTTTVKPTWKSVSMTDNDNTVTVGYNKMIVGDPNGIASILPGATIDSSTTGVVNTSYGSGSTISSTTKKYLSFSGNAATLQPVIVSSGSDCVTQTIGHLKFTGDSVNTGSAGSHSHTLDASATNSLTFSGTKVRLSGITASHTHTIPVDGITVDGTTSSEGDHTHTVQGDVSGSGFGIGYTVQTLTHVPKP